MKKYTQQYLITCDNYEPAFTEWFDAQNHFNVHLKMVVYDLRNHLYTKDGVNWKPIESDHL